MINKLLQIIAPHYCYGCAKVGVVLCDNCKYDIIDEASDACIVCMAPSGHGICPACRSSYDRAWCLGEREGVLRAVIDAYKFERVKDGADTLASLFDGYLPLLPNNTVIVAIPTIRSHIRRRGYDHAALLARSFAAKRTLCFRPLLRRMSSTVQLGKSKRVRMAQAAESFDCTEKLDPDRIYLIIDDVVTTNASLRYAADALRRAGAETVWAVVLARQPIGNKKDP